MTIEIDPDLSKAANVCRGTRLFLLRCLFAFSFCLLFLNIPPVCFSQSLPELPKVIESHQSQVTVSLNGRTEATTIGGAVGPWTVMAVNSRFVVFEDFREKDGQIVFSMANGTNQVFPKSLEPTFADSKALYQGHTLKEILESPVDILGSSILAKAADPSYESVSPLLEPLSNFYTGTYSFVGTPTNYDKVPFEYGGKTPNVDPSQFDPGIISVRNERKVWDGLVGGWLPILRFVYPEEQGDWTELVAFAPFRMENGNQWMQPVWYRIARITNGRLKWVRYIDSYIPVPPREEASGTGFYEDLLNMREAWNHELDGSMKVSLPDRRLEAMSRYSLVRILMTRMDSSPKYGVVDQNYGHTQHDGFQDTFNAETLAFVEWGDFDTAKRYIDNYLQKWVRDDGSLLYRGPEIGQYGRMLTNLAEYADYTRDYAILLKYRVRIDAIAQILLQLRQKALAINKEDARHGLLAGFSEADAVLMPSPERYMVPYYGNSTEAERGLGDLGNALTKTDDPEQRKFGTDLQRIAVELDRDVQSSVNRTHYENSVATCIPAIAGGRPPNEALARDGKAPEMYSDRSYAEMLFSGSLTHEQVHNIIRCRSTNNDMVLGMPSIASRGDGKKLDGYLFYAHAYGLIQHDFVREYLLLLYSTMAHLYTRGSWTATEVRGIDPQGISYPYATPAQAVVPLMTRWMLVFEDPRSNELWLTKATPRDWLMDGKKIGVSDAPTRYGKISFQIVSNLRNRRVEVSLDLPQNPVGGRIHIRLRAPEGNVIGSVTLDGQQIQDFDPISETITLAAGASGRKDIVVHYQ